MHVTSIQSLPLEIFGFVLALCNATDLYAISHVNRLFNRTSRERRRAISKLHGPPYNIQKPISNVIKVLCCKNIGDSGLASLADACVKGALAQCQHLCLPYNDIGDSGLSVLSRALVSGALARLVLIDLMRNRIGNIGLTSLANACAPRQTVAGHLCAVRYHFSRFRHGKQRGC